MLSRSLAILAIVLSWSVSCSSIYYGTMEKFGYAKRDILVERVGEGRDAQNAAKEQFQTALEAFRQVASFEGGDLEAVYNKLKHEYDTSSSRVQTVNDRIASIETVANDLFREWSTEIDQISSADLKAKSQQKLHDTQSRYDQLIGAMKSAAGKMDPVLVSFKDRVLYLKHNLNASAITSLQSDLKTIESDVGELMRDMEQSIQQANDFIAQMDAST